MWRSWWRPLAAALLCLAHAWPEAAARAQSNYASHGINIEYAGGENELPEFAPLDGRVVELDSLSPVIYLNRTEAHLACSSGFMDVDLHFKEPFYGLAYANFERSSPCAVSGEGLTVYRLQMPLRGCGTRQGPQRVFTNNIVVRFHPGLEMEGDEVITVVCRYPPPVVQPPGPVPLPVVVSEGPLPPAASSRLQEFEILLIICAILFLGLMLLGIGCSYYCLKKRNIQLVRRRPLSMAGSELTAGKPSSLSQLSMFDGLKIPRAQATSTSGSEAALMVEASPPSDTIPSDYPSESPSSAHSEVEDVDTMLPRPSSASSAEMDRAFVDVHDRHLQQMEATKRESRFDVALRVKKAAVPQEEQQSALQERLQTVLEREESMASEDAEARTRFTLVPELHPPPRGLPAAYIPDDRSIPDNDDWSVAETLVPADQQVTAPKRTLHTWQTDLVDTHVDREHLERVTKHFAVVPPPPPMPPLRTAVSSDYDVMETTSSVPQTAQPPRRPHLTTQEVEDVYLKTITEKKIIEDIERRRRETTEYLPKVPPPPPPPPPTQWEVAIRTYPDPNQPEEGDMAGGRPRAMDWETFSETTTDAGSERPWSVVGDEADDEEDDRHPYPTSVPAPMHFSSQPPPSPPRNWDVLIRVLDSMTESSAPVPAQGPVQGPDRVVLSEEDRARWRDIITTESTLRTLLTSATVREDYERIRRDTRYQMLFEPKKWDVIIRVLADPQQHGPSSLQQPPRFRKNRGGPVAAPGPRGSLPPLYETYESSDAASSRAHWASERSRRASATSLSMRSEADVRSMTEEMVNFSRPAHDRDFDADTLSLSSGPSFANPYQPLTDDEDDDDHPRASLARSASEFTENWAAVSIPDETSLSSSVSGRGLFGASTTGGELRSQVLVRQVEKMAAGSSEEMHSETVFSSDFHLHHQEQRRR